MDLAKLAIRKQVVSMLITLLVLIGGYVAYNLLPRFEDPEFIIRQAQIITPYPGATSLTVAEEVTDVLENNLQQLEGVKEIRSISTPGVSEITIEFEIFASPDRNTLNQRFTQLRAKVDNARASLPPNAGTPVVYDDYGDVYGIYYAITGDGYSLTEVYEYAKELQKSLVLVDGVSKIALQGAPQQVIYVEYSPARLSQLGISSGQLAQVLEGQNLVTTSGEAVMGNERIRIRPDMAIDSEKTIEALRITNPSNGATYRLGDIAEVWRGTEDPIGVRIYADGKPAIGMGISNVRGGNVVEMGNAVKQRFAELEAEGTRPLGIEIKSISDQSVSVKVSVDGFVTNVVVALGIVAGTLLIFMGLRSGLLMGAVLLVTVAGTLLGMYLWGLDMQRISLGALIIALGMLVDNAIVVVEGTLVRVQRGESITGAAGKVVDQTKWPLLGGTIVGIVAFSPIGFSPDNTSEFAGSLFWTILIALFFSWLVAVWLTPFYCSLAFRGMKKSNDDPENPGKENFLLHGFRLLIKLAIKVRWITVALVCLLFASAMYSFPAVPKGFFPASNRAQFAIDYYLPTDTDSSKTIEDIHAISDWVRQQAHVVGTTSAVGGGHIRFMLTYSSASREPSYGQVLVDTETPEYIDGLIAITQKYLGENYPDADIKVWRFILGPSSGSKIEARFSGPDPAELRRLSEQARVVFAEEGGEAIRDDWRSQVKTIHPIVNDVSARRVGLSSADIADALQEHFSGVQIGVLREDDELRRIVFRPGAEYRQSPDDLRSVMVFSPAIGRAIPISQVIDGYEIIFDDYKVRRLDRAFTITAMADPGAGVNANNLYQRIRPKVDAMELPTGYTLEWRGEAGNSADAQQGLAATMPLGFLAMIIVVVLLFDAVRQPLVIWLAVPLALIGIVYGLIFMNSAMDFMAILGSLSLIGMMIKNAIVLVDETDIQIAKGRPRMTAVVDAAVSRVRPVMLGMLTTVLGVTPLLYDPFFKSLAVVIIFGLSFATLLTLIFVPVLYTIFFRIRKNEVTPAPVSTVTPDTDPDAGEGAVVTNS
ncbi:MAG TPA: efflux RND transporter permease subunit [Thiolinea sp.]|nr:efflux RND transporter permease subunit [Thiolinea sp.]